MDEVTLQDDTELFDSVDPENVSPPVSTNNDEDPKPEEAEGTDSPIEENNEQLDLKEDKATSANREREIMLKSWETKIMTGDKTLDDLPKSQKWMKAELEVRLHAKNKAEEISEQYDIDAMLERKLAEKESARQFDSIRAELNAAHLTQQQKADLKAEYTDFRDAGLDKASAITKAMKVAGVTIDPTEARRRNMVIPNTGNPSKPSDERDFRVKYKNDPAKRLAELERLNNL